MFKYHIPTTPTPTTKLRLRFNSMPLWYRAKIWLKVKIIGWLMAHKLY